MPLRNPTAIANFMVPVCVPMLEKPSPSHSFTKQIVPSLCQESLTRSSLRSFSPVLCMLLINCFLPYKTFLCVHCFFFVSTFFVSFSSHFHGLAEACMNPGSFFKLSFYTFTLFVK